MLEIGKKTLSEEFFYKGLNESTKDVNFEVFLLRLGLGFLLLLLGSSFLLLLVILLGGGSAGGNGTR